jgi:DNA-directed RNA polymerase specialized sigma24 family protein
VTDLSMATAMPTSTPEAVFTALHQTYRARVENYIVTRLPRPDRQLAEDLATECFLSLWRTYLEPGRTINDRPFGLLATIAARRVYDHYRLARNTREVAADTGDWEFSNREMTTGPAGTYTAAPSGFRTATLAGAR